MNLSAVDLNLLVIFDALYQERQVTRAANRVRLTQPAVSNALRRLRTMFGDVLFVRVGNVMEPTKRAREVSEQISAVLTQVVQILGPLNFEPKQSKLVVRFGTSDHVEHTLLPRLLAGIRSCAPDTRMVSQRVTGLFELPRHELERGLIDFAIGPFSLPSSPLTGIKGCLLYHEPFVCIMNARHAMRLITLSMSEFIRLEHIVVCYPGEDPGLVDRTLAERNATRTTVLTVPHFVSAAFAVAASGCIATVPQSLALALAEPLGLSVLTPPFQLAPMAIGAFWHKRTDAELGSTWIRAQIVAAAKQFCRVVENGAVLA